MKIREIGDVITGKTPMTSKPEYFDGDIMFITPSDIVNGYRIDASVRHISESGYKSIQTNTLSGISVLIGCIGSDMGNVALVQERCATNQQINAITNFCENVNPFYVYYLLSMKKKYFQKMAGVTTTPILPKTVLEDIDILLPTLSESPVSTAHSRPSRRRRCGRACRSYPENRTAQTSSHRGFLP